MINAEQRAVNAMRFIDHVKQLPLEQRLPFLRLCTVKVLREVAIATAMMIPHNANKDELARLVARSC